MKNIQEIQILQNTNGMKERLKQKKISDEGRPVFLKYLLVHVK